MSSKGNDNIFGWRTGSKWTPSIGWCLPFAVEILGHGMLDIFGEMANGEITKFIQQVMGKYRVGIYVDSCLAYQRLTIIASLYICLSLLRRISIQRHFCKFSCWHQIHQVCFGGSWRKSRVGIPQHVLERVLDPWAVSLQNRFNKGKPEWIADHGFPRHALSIR